MMSLLESLSNALLETDVDAKLAQVSKIFDGLTEAQCQKAAVSPLPIHRVVEPGRPADPELVTPAQLKPRKLIHKEGLASLLHAIAHIEFNAINLALDAAYRFRHMPAQYYTDWVGIAYEEARHFKLLRQRLQALGYEYGDFPAHNGLWEMAYDTDHDVMVRMALVPRVLEARGLDVTPAMISRLKEVGDQLSIEVLKIIERDEVGHVAIGSHWYKYVCKARSLPPETTFVGLFKKHFHGPYKGPMNMPARLAAGFSMEEMKLMLQQVG